MQSIEKWSKVRQSHRRKCILWTSPWRSFYQCYSCECIIRPLVMWPSHLLRSPIWQNWIWFFDYAVGVQPQLENFALWNLFSTWIFPSACVLFNVTFIPNFVMFTLMDLMLSDYWIIDSYFFPYTYTITVITRNE